MSMRYWNIPLAAGIALLIMLSLVSYNNNLSLVKEAELMRPILFPQLLNWTAKI